MSEGVRAGPGPAGLPMPQRLAISMVLALVALVARVPPGISYRLAGAAGVIMYLVSPVRRALVRANLTRVCAWLDESGAASPRVREAAHDRGALEAMVRDVFRNWAMTYLESAVAPHWSEDFLRARVEVVGPEVVERALSPLPPGAIGRIYTSPHLGSAELAGLYATRVAGLHLTGPMEIVRGRLAAAYFWRVRERYGVRLVPTRGSAPGLRAALSRGEGVALVADRAIGVEGTRVTLFGATARLPAGTAVLAVSADAPIFVLSLLRLGPARWRARMLELTLPPGVPRREAARLLLAEQVRAFEALIGEAPEQWWTLLFPIWEDDAQRRRA